MRRKLILLALSICLTMLPAPSSAGGGRGQFCHCKGTKEYCLVNGKWTPSGSTLCKPVRYPRR